MATAVATAEPTTAFEPVEFWNAREPNLVLRVPTNLKDRAADRIVRFLGGYVRATEPWQVEAIEQHVPEAKRADVPVTMTCKKCPFSTKNSELYAWHVDQH